MADKVSLINLETFRFVDVDKKSKPFEILVPFFFWDFDEETEHKVISNFSKYGNLFKNEVSVYKKVEKIELRHLRVELQRGYKPATIEFLDEKTHSWQHLDLLVTSDTRPKGTSSRELQALDFICHVGDRKLSHHIDFRVPNTYFMTSGESVRFRWIDLLGKKEAPVYTNQQFSYGIRYEQLNVEYRHKKLDGKSYALVVGPWCILLKDDLSYDSLATLRGTAQHTLYIDKFIHTVNPYIVKVIMLKR